MKQTVINMSLVAENGHARIVVKLKRIDYLTELISVSGEKEFGISSSLSLKQKRRDMKRLLSIGQDCGTRWLREDTRILNFSGQKSLRTGIGICILWYLPTSRNMR